MSAAVTQDTLALLAAELAEAGATRQPVAPIVERHPELTVADAYEIQSINAADRAIRGHKIGLTSKAMQEMLGVSEPDYGRVFASELLADGDEVERRELIAPRVEPEIAFVLAYGLEGPGVTAADVIAATDYVVPALEVIDSRIADWKIGLVDTVADNASCARVVVGNQRTKLDDIDLIAETVQLKIDGEVVQEGAGEAVLGHPAEAVAWLANSVGDFGIRLESGQVIMPGSLCAAAPLEAGQTVVAEFASLGSVEVRCS